MKGPSPHCNFKEVLRYAGAVVPLQEKEPMGTAGPLALARSILDDGQGTPFFVMNRCAMHSVCPFPPS